jgi:nicotinate-nucleotide--dimethylbenzimidazole phosphoribosyltransferase
MAYPTLGEAIAEIRPADSKAMRRAKARQKQLTKPPGSLGRLEALSIQLAGIFRTERPSPQGKTVIVAAGDHGVVAQGVTGYPQEVTAQMVLNFLGGGAAVSVMARKVGIKLMVVDAGVATPLPEHPSLHVVGVGMGTADITQRPAMTRQQAEACVTAGIRLALEAVETGADILGTGDMGIGNTTASSAIVAALTGKSPVETTGRGTGRNTEEMAHKTACVERALLVNGPDRDDGLDVLAKVGGFEIGVLVGVVLGGALARRAVVLDGFISGAAGLIAYSLCPDAHDYIIASHRSAEKGHKVALAHMKLRPVLDLGMRLGEGTGAVLAMPIVEAAAACLSDMATFAEAGVSDRESVGESETMAEEAR